jgi:hypothetical protein
VARRSLSPVLGKEGGGDGRQDWGYRQRGRRRLRVARRSRPPALGEEGGGRGRPGAADERVGDAA